MFNFLKRLFRNKHPQERIYPNSTTLLWNKGIAMLCNRYDFYSEFRTDRYQDIQPGEIVWVKGKFILQFFREVFPLIKHPFVLVTGDSTISLPKEIESPEIEKILNHPHLCHWFAQNCDLTNPKISNISPLPLGIDFHSQFEKTTWRYKELLTPLAQENLLLQVRDSSNQNKENLAYADFYFNNTTRLLVRRDHKITKDRDDIHKQLKNNPAVFFPQKRLSRDELWKEMSRFSFVISPHGSGLDCHRTWEALVLGCYVIVETSVLDPLYQNLPVKIVNDFSEISPETLQQWKEDFELRYDYQEYFSRLTNHYWFEKIQQKADQIPR